MERKAVLSPLAVVALAVATLGGCTNENVTGSDRVELEERVFSEEGFPEGTQFGEVSDSRQFYVDLEKSLDVSEFVPFECKGPRIEAAHRSAEIASQTQSFVTPAGNRYAVSVLDRTIPRELLVDTVSGTCADATATNFNGKLAINTTRQTTKVLDLRADRFAYEQVNETRTELPGDTSPPTTAGQREGFAWVRESMVRVNQTVPSLGEDNCAEFVSIFDKAIERARS